MPVLSSSSLHELVVAVSGRGGSTAGEAELIADHLVEANLTGHDSHGVGVLPLYVAGLRAGTLVANRHAEVASDRGSVLTINGGRGYGQVIGHEAMQLGMARAAEHGVALVAIRNTHHLGRIGHWAEQCARGGFASIHFVNGIHHEPVVAPHGGKEARFITNPFCVGLPGERGPALLLDMATSKIAMGKARVAHNKGVRVPPGSVIDPSGRLSDEPDFLFDEPRGALVAMGEHKGSGLAIACELVAGALTGGGTLQPAHERDGSLVNNMLSIVIDPKALGVAGWLEVEAQAFLEWVKTSPPRPGFEEVLTPGEPERRWRVRRLRDGIEIDQRSWTEIREAALAVGLGAADVDAITG